MDSSIIEKSNIAKVDGTSVSEVHQESDQKESSKVAEHVDSSKQVTLLLEKFKTYQNSVKSVEVKVQEGTQKLREVMRLSIGEGEKNDQIVEEAIREHFQGLNEFLEDTVKQTAVLQVIISEKSSESKDMKKQQEQEKQKKAAVEKQKQGQGDPSPIQVINDAIKPIKTNLILLGIFLAIMIPITIKDQRERGLFDMHEKKELNLQQLIERKEYLIMPQTFKQNQGQSSPFLITKDGHVFSEIPLTLQMFDKNLNLQKEQPIEDKVISYLQIEDSVYVAIDQRIFIFDQKYLEMSTDIITRNKVMDMISLIEGQFILCLEEIGIIEVIDLKQGKIVHIVKSDQQLKLIQKVSNFEFLVQTQDQSIQFYKMTADTYDGIQSLLENRSELIYIQTNESYSSVENARCMAFVDTTLYYWDHAAQTLKVIERSTQKQLKQITISSGMQQDCISLELMLDFNSLHQPFLIFLSSNQLTVINVKTYDKLYLSNLNHDTNLKYNQLHKHKQNRNLEITLVIENSKTGSHSLEKIIIYNAFIF